ncbi:TIR domain-containing protein [Roseomonas sp. GCM10028921]
MSANLSNQKPSQPARVFFSYVEDVRAFVDQFAEALIDNEGRLAREDWCITPLHPGESLSKGLAARIELADVFIAFVDKTYQERIGAKELHAVLQQHERGERRPVLIPIILGIDGLNWWTALSNEVQLPGGLSDVVRKGFFIKGTNKWRSLTTDDTQQIQALRNWLIGEFRSVPLPDPGLPPLVADPILRPVWGPFGRDQQICKVVKALTKDQPQPVAVLGGPGLGKSTVLRAVLHDPAVSKKFGSDRLFLVNCDQAADAGVLWRRLALAVGAEPIRGKIELGAMAVLRNTPAVMVLDGLEAVWLQDWQGTEKALASLADLSKLALLAAWTGDQPPGVIKWDRVPLPPLKIEDARKLFLQIAPEHSSRTVQTDALLHDLDGLPLAVMLMAHAAQGEPDLDGVRRRWEKERLDFLVRFPGAEGDRQTSARAAFEVSLIAPGMDDQDSRCLLCLLALMPIGLPRADLVSVLPSGSEKAASTLRRAGLVLDENSRLRVLGPIRLYVADTEKIHPTEKAKALALAISHYQGLLSHLTLALRGGAVASYAAIRREGPNLAKVLQLGLQGTSTLPKWAGLSLVRQANAFANYLFLFGLYKLARQYLRDARDYATSLDDEDGLKLSLLNQGRIAEKLGEYDEAEAALQQACAGSLDEEENIVRIAAASHILGIIAFNRGKYAKAKKVLKDGFRHLEGISDTSCFAADRDYIRSDLYERGCVIALGEGKYKIARQQGERGLKIAQDLRDDFRTAIHLKNFTWLALREGNFLRAKELGEEGLKHARLTDKAAGAVRDKGFLGEIAGLYGLLTEAYDYLHEAEAAERSAREGWRAAVYAHHKWYKAHMAKQWGELRLRHGDITFAHRAFYRAACIAKAIKSPDLQAQAEFGLARVAQARGGTQPEILQHAQLCLKLLQRHRLWRHASEVKQWLAAGGLAVEADG